MKGEKNEMKKTLDEMTLEELWMLFPILLKEYNPLYPVWYEEEARKILATVGDVFRVSHIGSTAVEGLLSKPTVDILLELTPREDAEKAARALKGEWTLMSESEDPWKLSFNKGYTPDGFAEKVFHLHVRRAGDWDELYFRDYLRENPSVAAKYALLKRELKEKFERNRDGYTAAKTDFIKEMTARARLCYGTRYRPKLRP